MALQILGGLFGIAFGGAIMAAHYRLKPEATVLAACAATMAAAIYVLK